MITKRKIIYILTSVVVFLLLLNVLLGFVNISMPSNKSDSISKRIIDEKFLKVLSDYGISENWITNGKIQNGKSDSLKNSLIVRLPEDVPIAQIIKDINIEFTNQPVVISSSEEKINGLTNLIIESGKIIKLIADFKNEENLVRDFCFIGFILQNVEELNEAEFNELTENPIHFGAVLPLEVNSTIVAENLIKAKKEYFIELDDDSDNLNFDLSDDIETPEIKSNIKRIISSFNSPRIFFIDENNTGINKSIQKIIDEKLTERNRSLVFFNRLTFLKGENSEDLKSIFRFHLSNMKNGQAKTFRINVDDWFLIQDELTQIMKRGDRIVNPSTLL